MTHIYTRVWLCYHQEHLFVAAIVGFHSCGSRIFQSWHPQTPTMLCIMSMLDEPFNTGFWRGRQLHQKITKLQQDISWPHNDTTTSNVARRLQDASPQQCSPMPKCRPPWSSISRWRFSERWTDSWNIFKLAATPWMLQIQILNVYLWGKSALLLICA